MTGRRKMQTLSDYITPDATVNAAERPTGTTSRRRFLQGIPLTGLVLYVGIPGIAA